MPPFVIRIKDESNRASLILGRRIVRRLMHRLVFLFSYADTI